MDRKQSKKEYKRSRSRSEKHKKRDRKKKKDKKNKKHSKKTSRSSSSNSNSSSSRSSSNSSQKNNAPTQQKIKVIPLVTPANLQQQQQSSSNLSQSVLQMLASGQSTASLNPTAPRERERRNVFSTPPKQSSGFGVSMAGNNSNPANQMSQPAVNPAGQPVLSAPVSNILQDSVEAPQLPGGLITTTAQAGAAGNLLDISLAGMPGMMDPAVYGNKIPPPLQKNYIHAVRLYIGNLPDPLDVDEICAFFYQQMIIAGGLVEQGNPILGKKHDPVKKFLFLQLRSMEETTACMELDGIIYRGKCLRLRRPRDYTVMPKVEGTRPVPVMDKSHLKIVATQVEVAYNKLQIMNLPENFSEEHVMQLLSTYGDLKSFHLALDKMNSESKGFAFCEYKTDRATVECLARLPGQNVFGKVIAVKRCNPNLAPPKEEPIFTLEQLSKNLVESVNKQITEKGEKEFPEEYINKMLTIYIPKYDGLICEDATNILRIQNIVNKQLIEENAEYELVFNDLKQQLERIGKIKQIVIPRKKEKYVEGIGYVYVEFDNEKTAQIASYLISKLKYDGRDVKTEFYSPQYFADKTFF